jgi:hypothetical protein
LTYTRTTAVRENVVVFTVSRPPQHASRHRMVWRAGDGHVVGVVSAD